MMTTHRVPPRGRARRAAHSVSYVLTSSMCLRVASPIATLGPPDHHATFPRHWVELMDPRQEHVARGARLLVETIEALVRRAPSVPEAAPVCCTRRVTALSRALDAPGCGIDGRGSLRQSAVYAVGN